MKKQLAGLLIVLLLLTVGGVWASDGPSSAPAQAKAAKATPTGSEGATLQRNGSSTPLPAGEKETMAGGETAVPLAGGGGLIPCDKKDDEWTTTSSNPEKVAECQITAPSSGKVLLVANLWLRHENGYYEADFRVQGPVRAVGRQVDVYGGGTDGTDKSVTLSTIHDVAAGFHAVSLFGSRIDGTGTVKADDITISALFIPDESEVKTCHNADFHWSTSVDTAYQTILDCSLTAPEAGWAMVIGNGSAGGGSGHPYEAEFSIDIDETDGDAEAQRWFNYYDDAHADGSDGSVTVMALRPVSAGEHDFYFLGQRFDGVSTVQLADPTLSVLYIPGDSVHAKTCGATDHGWTTTASALESAIDCDLDVPQRSWAFVAANGAMGAANGAYEAQFRLGLDNTGLDWSDRYINIDTDSGDGMDRPLTVSGLFPVSGGQHTFHLLGGRWGGAGAVQLYESSITVLVPGADLFVPMIQR
jgi:hypothetical protein